MIRLKAAGSLRVLCTSHAAAAAAAHATPQQLSTTPGATLAPTAASHRAIGSSSNGLQVAMTLATHPYFPLDLHLPGYVPMQVEFDYILGVFFAAVFLVFAATWWLSGG